MHLFRLWHGVAVAEIASVAASYIFISENNYNYYLHEGRPYEDSPTYFSGRETRPEEDKIYYFTRRDADTDDYDLDFHIRDAEPEAESEVYAIDDFELYGLYSRGLMDAKLPGGNIGRIANGVRGVIKANDSLQRKRQRDAAKKVGSFQRPGRGSNNKGSSKKAPAGFAPSASKKNPSSKKSGGGSKILGQVKKNNGGSTFPKKKSAGRKVPSKKPKVRFPKKKKG